MKTAFINGKVYIEKGHFEEALLVEGNRILLAGTSAAVKKAAEGAEIYDCGGRTVLPGINDSHMHIMQVGCGLHQVQIDDVTSIEEMIERTRKFLEKNPESCQNGIHAIGWNQDRFVDGDRLPDRHDLDKISTEIPVVLERICGHIISANTKAIEMAGLDGKTPQFPGGEFKIGSDGYPSGLFYENACNYIKTVVPDFTWEQKKAYVLEVLDYAAAHGVTSLQSNDPGCSDMDFAGTFQMYHDIYDSGKGKVRCRLQVAYETAKDFQRGLESGEYAKGNYPSDSLLTLGPLKLFADGSLGARTAYMTKDYADDPGNRGTVWMAQDEMEKCCQIAAERHIQVVTHTIGDGALDNVLKAYEKADKGGNPNRNTIIHCQITRREQLEKMAERNILAAVQPIFLEYDLHIAEDRCGKELASTSYAFRTMKNLGIHESFGTDSPVEDINPFPNIYSAVTRKDLNGEPEGGFFTGECMDREDAVDAYTCESAYMEFAEKEKGRLKPGYLADLIVLDKDIFTCPEEEIKNIHPVLTMVDGKKVYEE